MPAAEALYVEQDVYCRGCGLPVGRARLALHPTGGAALLASVDLDGTPAYRLVEDRRAGHECPGGGS